MFDLKAAIVEAKTAKEAQDKAARSQQDQAVWGIYQDHEPAFRKTLEARLGPLVSDLSIEISLNDSHSYDHLTYVKAVFRVDGLVFRLSYRKEYPERYGVKLFCDVYSEPEDDEEENFFLSSYDAFQVEEDMDQQRFLLFIDDCLERYRVWLAKRQAPQVLPVDPENIPIPQNHFSSEFIKFACSSAAEMNLRNHFIGQAIAGLAANPSHEDALPQDIAIAACKIADATLNEILRGGTDAS